MLVGCHLSTAKGYMGMAREAVRIGADTFQFFTRNPRGSKAKALDPEDVRQFNQFASEKGLGPILGHAAYTVNPAAAEPERREFSLGIMADDIGRLEETPGARYNFHPGHHPQPTSDQALRLVAEALNAVLEKSQQTVVLLETMSGHTSEVGGSFESLRDIIAGVELRDRVGVCLDTCHVFAAGYDIVGQLDLVMRGFDAVVGLERLKAVHCNDSKFPLGSRMDRHEFIGQGEIGIEGFRGLVNHPALREVPFYLETHSDPDGYGREMNLLRSLQEKNK